MAKNRNYGKDVVPSSNPLAQYDPEQPSFIPEVFRKTYKRSVYFPKRKAYVLYQVSQMIKEAARAGTKMSFNDVAIEALELWYEQNKRRHIAWLFHRLRVERDSLAHKLKSFKGMSKRQSETSQLSNQHDKIKEAISQIEKFLYENQPTITTGDYEMLVTEIVQSLKKRSPFEMRRALSKVLARSDIHELAAQVRHKPKIKKQESIFSKSKDEESEWYE
jgi:hypothetical protein